MAWGKDRIQIDDGFEGWDLDLGIPPPITSSYPKFISELPSVISSFDSIHGLIETIAFSRSFQHKRFLFRGHPDSSYNLVSTIGRCKAVDYASEYKAFNLLQDLCDREGYSRYRMESFNEELFYYGIGRHLGLTCRLLDWTAGIWEALSFALYEQIDKDGSLWVMMLSNDFPFENRSPFSISDNRIHVLKEDYYYPDESTSLPLGIQRRSHQHGYFSVVKDAWISSPLNEVSYDSPCDFYCFNIPPAFKELLRLDKRILEVDSWLYINNDAQIIDRIQRINQIITNTASNE